MQRIGDITPTADANSEWTNGNVAAGTPPTLIEAEWLNTVQRELINILTIAGVSPDPSKDNQVMSALAGFFLQNLNNLSEIKAAGTTAQDSARTNIGAAALAGLETQLFSVATATTDNHAVNLKQLTSVITALSLGTASKANIGTGSGQLPSMASFTSGFSPGTSAQFSGFFTLPNKLLLQYGRVALFNTGNIATIGLPLAYADNNFAVLASSDLATTGNTLFPLFNARPASASTINMQQSMTTDGYACYWITIGRTS